MEQIRKWRMMRFMVVFLLMSFSVLSFVPRADAAYLSNYDMLSSKLGGKDADMDTIQNTLENKMVLERLEALGYSKEEISERLAMLTPEERHDLATRIDSLQSGQGFWGVVLGILVVALLVVLILYFADKRIVVQ
jgi:hypothetical protein